MKKHFAAMLACLAASTAMASDSTESVRQIRASTPCIERPARVTAYLNASRHGSFISDTIGSTNGIVLDFDAASSDRSIDKMVTYNARPRDYMGRTFHAIFHGTLKCAPGENRPVAIRVDKIDGVKISLIKDAKK
jgi:hypothetical protein